MIPLKHAIEHRPRDARPYCVRLRASPLASGDAKLLQTSGGAQVASEFGEFTLRLEEASQFEGDVLAVFPGRSVAMRLIRANSRANTIVLTEECDQLCVMCSQPPRSMRYDHMELYRRAIELAPTGSVIGISGGEPTLLRSQLFDLLLWASKSRDDIAFHILSNAQHFDAGDQPKLKALGPTVLWGVPIYAADARLHDSIVGKVGAHARLLESMQLLSEAGAQVELRTVVLRTNWLALPDLADFVVTHLPDVRCWALMQLERFGYGKLNWKAIFADTSVDFSQLSIALSVASAAGLDVRLYNFPLCSVPADFRGVAHASISDWKQKYLAFCAQCTQRGNCGGFFEWFVRHSATGRLGPYEVRGTPYQSLGRARDA